jgi:thioredoxin reductase (NADPH)
MAKGPTHYTAIIIGAGPIGLACGLEAQKRKIDHLIIEKGCLVNSLYNYPANMTFFSTSERLEIGSVPFVSNNPKPTRAEALEYYRRVAVTKKLAVRLFEEVKSVKRPTVTGKLPLFKLTTDKASYTCHFLVIASGFYDIPYRLDVPGEDLPKVTHYYRDPHFYAMQDVLVVGANNSAVDAALETWRKGARVTMVVRKEDIGERVKYWVRPDIINRIKEGSIRVFFNSMIKEITEQNVLIQTPEGERIIPNDWVIAMTGYQPNLGFLKKTGIRLSRDEVKKPSYDEKTHESNVKGVYLAGVICGGMNTHRLFIENSRIHATRIFRDIVRKMPKKKAQ